MIFFVIEQSIEQGRPGPSFELEDFETALVAFWKNRRRQTEIIHKKRNPLDRGKLVYSDCSSHRRTLKAWKSRIIFTPGSFHALATSRMWPAPEPVRS